MPPSGVSYGCYWSHSEASMRSILLKKLIVERVSAGKFIVSKRSRVNNDDSFFYFDIILIFRFNNCRYRFRSSKPLFIDFGHKFVSNKFDTRHPLQWLFLFMFHSTIVWCVIARATRIPDVQIRWLLSPENTHSICPGICSNFLQTQTVDIYFFLIHFVTLCARSIRRIHLRGSHFMTSSRLPTLFKYIWRIFEGAHSSSVK